MNLFADTSALVKLIHDESGSDAMVKLVDASATRLWALDLARVELASALCRRFTAGELTQAALAKAMQGIDDLSASISFEAMSHAVVVESEKLMRQHAKTDALRTLDALHLAAAVLIAEPSWTFVTADVRQAQVARHVGLHVTEIHWATRIKCMNTQ